ncbi:MAG TPA: type II toxin-antitoxin system RelB/DinJ family antitoxin [Candidatus Paceibacterota bacterium]|nr:type II toxin-antitoxin system RelB/DinJ family antitoxin [Candidatus Paceibacterota bacterium]
MSEQQTIQIRIDKKTKEAARQTLSELGLDMSTAVKLFLTNVVNRQGIPFEIRTKNGFTEAEELAMIAETEEAKRSGKRYTSLDELFADLEI